MLKGLNACHSSVQICRHQPRDEVDHVFEAVTVTEALELQCEVYLPSQKTIRLEELLTSAHVVHQAAEGPAVDPEIRVSVLSGLRGAPLPQTGSPEHLVCLRCCFYRYIKID